jgi:deoxyinosine 3'endonuclease (endonuclease V)
LKSRDEATNPIYVSIGHKISLESARQVVLAASKFRVPEPIRFADYLSREFIRKKETPKTTKKQGKSK